MKWLAVFLLLLYSFASVGQMSDNAIHKICLQQYDIYRKSRLVVSIGITGPILPDSMVCVTELFKDYFKKVRIFMVVNCQQEHESHGGGYWPNLYALDAYTGKQVSFEDKETFNTFMRSAKKEIVNLDKAYLCLFFMFHEDITKRIIAPRFYSGLGNGSLFREQEDRLFIYHGNRERVLYPGERPEAVCDASRCTNKNICIVTDNVAQKFELVYHFNFDNYNRLSSAIRDTFYFHSQ